MPASSGLLLCRKANESEVQRKNNITQQPLRVCLAHGLSAAQETPRLPSEEHLKRHKPDHFSAFSFFKPAVSHLPAYIWLQFALIIPKSCLLLFLSLRMETLLMCRNAAHTHTHQTHLHKCMLAHILPQCSLETEKKNSKRPNLTKSSPHRFGETVLPLTQTEPVLLLQWKILLPVFREAQTAEMWFPFWNK